MPSVREIFSELSATYMNFVMQCVKKSAVMVLAVEIEAELSKPPKSKLIIRQLTR